MIEDVHTLKQCHLPDLIEHHRLHCCLQNTPYPQGGMGLLNSMSYGQPSAGYGYQSPMVRTQKNHLLIFIYLFVA